MKITWRDEDGDDVSIESDEELLIALHEMKGKSQVQNKYKKKVQNGLDRIGSDKILAFVFLIKNIPYFIFRTPVQAIRDCLSPGSAQADRYSTS